MEVLKLACQGRARAAEEVELPSWAVQVELRLQSYFESDVGQQRVAVMVGAAGLFSWWWATQSYHPQPTRSAAIGVAIPGGSQRQA